MQQQLQLAAVHHDYSVAGEKVHVAAIPLQGAALERSLSFSFLQLMSKWKGDHL